MKHTEGQAVTRQKPVKKGLGDILIEENLVTEEQLKSALAAQRQKGGRLSDVLLQQGAINAEEMAIILSIQLNLPLIDLKRHTVQPQALALVPEAIARQHTLIPLDIISGSLLVVMADPEDLRAIEDVRARAKMKIEVVLGVRAQVERAIELNYRSNDAVGQVVEPPRPPNSVSTGEKSGTKTDDTPASTAKAPSAESLDLLITEAVRDRATDIHIEPQEQRLRISYRIDGVLHDMYSLPLSLHADIISRIKALSGMDVSELQGLPEKRFVIKLGGRDVEIHVATMDTPGGERVTLRLLDNSLALLPLDKLGLQPAVLEAYRVALKSSRGIILVVGPAGSGKTTTLYASMNELDPKQRKIMTIEDPIEHKFPDVEQDQVDGKAGTTFASGLRSIFSRDPDVILVGEIPDRETATAAFLSALSGHLVLSSIKAVDAAGVLTRLIDLDVAPSSFSSTLISILAQRMVRRICPDCKTHYKPSAEEARAFAAETGTSVPVLYQSPGCNFCANTGYRGRTGIFEFLVVTEPVREMLLSRAGAGDVRRQAIAGGMMTIRQDGMMKAREGITSIGEVIRSVFATV